MTDYDGVEILHEGQRSVVFRAVRRRDGRRVVVKALQAAPTTEDALRRARRELEIGASVSGPRALTYLSLETHDDGFGVLMEDDGATSLDRLIPPSGLPIARFLDLAVGVADGLARLHRGNVMHLDVNPANILILPDGAPCFCDFERSMRIDAAADPVQALRLEGTLPYIAPEQTGRVGRPVDPRSDLYALGVTLFEMLTGAPPFTAGDAMEMVHAHIAVRPPSPREARPDVPEQVAAVVLKLLEKSPDDRYRTARGLRHDLEQCRAAFAATGRVDPFLLGRHDVSPRLVLPDTFHGRRAEQEALLRAFADAAAGAPRFVLVRGWSGIGKSALIHRLDRPILERRGFFCAGKFDQLQRAAPYSALATALRGLIRDVLAQPASVVQAVRARILDAVGQSGQLLVDVIPELVSLIGPQPPPVEVGPTEAQARFHWLSQAFIAALASAEHPLAIFLDDLQWADDASLALVQALMTEGRARHLLLVGAYRDAEVDAAHPLALTRAMIERSQPVEEIALPALDHGEALALVAEILQRDVADVLDLGALVYGKTQGNPFFIRQFVRTLHQEGLLVFDEERGLWTWDIARVEATGFTDNVVELMVREIRRLDGEAQRALSLAACVGNRFSASTLAIVAESDADVIKPRLLEALGRGLLVPDGSLLAAARDGDLPLRFLHDRVQQAAYSLIPAEARPSIHLTIGRLLLRDVPPARREERIFEIVNHLDVGLDLVEGAAERLEIADLNQAAARRAKAANALPAAGAYLRTAFALLGPRPWEEHHARALAIRQDMIEVALLARDHDEMDRLITEVLSRARDVFERIPAHELRLHSYALRNRMSDAVNGAIDVLAELGVKLPRRPTRTGIVADLARTKWTLRGRDRAALLARPRMTDPRARAAMRILAGSVHAAFLALPDLFPHLVFAMLRLALEHGHCDESALACGLYAIVLAGALDDVPGAVLFQDVADTLCADLDLQRLRGEVISIRATFVDHRVRPVRETLDGLVEAYRVALATGDLQAPVRALATYCFNVLYAGVPLDEVASSIAGYMAPIERLGLTFNVRAMRLVDQFLRNLRDEAEDPRRLRGPGYDEAEDLDPRSGAIGSTLAALGLHQGWLAYLHRDLDRALDRFRLAEQHQDTLMGTLWTPMFHFLHALTRLALHDQMGRAARLESRLRVERSLRVLRTWARTAPMNHTHRVRLLEAERARLDGRIAEAMGLYDDAADLARRHDHLHEAPLCHELAARFYRGLGRAELAQGHFLRARQGFLVWGAKLKVRLLDEELGDWLRAEGPVSARAEPTRPRSASGSLSSESLDLDTVFKAAQAMSEEVTLDALLARLVHMLIQNAGASRGALILREDEALLVEVEATAREPGAVHRPRVSVDGAARLSAAIVHYVARTRESVVLPDACREGSFTRDPYVAASRARSVLCAPLLNQGQLTAIAYLENDLTAGAFTPERLALLRLLLSQAALSIHKARLYTNLERASERLRVSNERLEEYSRELERKVDERTRELQENNAALAAALDQLRQTQRQLVTQEKLASLGALTAGIAHELKNPLNFIINFAELTAGLTEDLGAEVRAALGGSPPESREEVTDLTAQVRDNVARIEEHGKRAGAILDAMLAHARPSNAQRSAVDLNAVVSQGVALACHARRAKEAVFDVQVDADYDAAAGTVEGMAQELSRVFVGMIGNAMDAMAERRRSAPRGYAPALRVRTRSLGEHVEVRICDNGTGIAEDVLDKIYNPFFTTKPTGQGAGLGLSIAHDIVVGGHQGEVRVESVPGEGTEFTVILPRHLATTAS